MTRTHGPVLCDDPLCNAATTPTLDEFELLLRAFDGAVRDDAVAFARRKGVDDPRLAITGEAFTTARTALIAAIRSLASDAERWREVRPLLVEHKEAMQEDHDSTQALADTYLAGTCNLAVEARCDNASIRKSKAERALAAYLASKEP